MLDPRRPVNPFRVLLTHANFRRFWIGQTLSLIGTWMQSMAIGWLALDLSNSAFIVGLVVACSALPILLFSLYAGVIVDHSDKLKIVRLAQSLLLVEASLLWWFTWTGHMNIPVLIALAVMGGIITSFEIPARQSLMIDLVGRDDLRDAIALNSSGFNLARIFGPAIAAAIIARWGLAWCFAVNATSYLTVLIGLALIELPPRIPAVATASPWDGMRAGVAHVAGDRRLRGLVETISVFAILGTPTLALMPVMARDQLNLGAGGYGLLLSAVGIGGLVGALTLAASSPRLRRGPLLMRSQYVFAGLIILLSLSRVPFMAYALLLATGCVLIVNSALGNTMMQAIVPDEYRGRLMAIYSLIVVGLPQVVGAFAAGAVARAVGISWTLALTGVLMILYGLWAFKRYPEIARL
ncbi:MAG: MFS transporter [Gemmatimonadaceae bacterium]